MGLISQAGVAIGLANVVVQVYPNRGVQIQTLFLAVLAINQTLGPILFRHALVRSGEVGGDETSAIATVDAQPIPGAPTPVEPVQR
jgi:hypothetical protein